MTAVAGISSIEVSWTAPAGDGQATSYRAIADPGPATCTTSGTSCVLGADPGTSYRVTVVAIGAGGESGPSNPSGAVTPTALEIPAEAPVGDGDLTTDEGTPATIIPGDQITIVGEGYAPHSTVTITVYSEPHSRHRCC